jgi:lipid II isoglutaminyl synthase (glutamine-hydrolysing)
MRPRLTLALLAGRTASLVSRRIGHGGTVLAGHIVPRIDPDALPYITRQLRHGSVVVSGTNGKTTTTRMISHVASRAGFQPIHNRSGANLMTGLVTAVASHTSLSGRPRGDLGVFEVDEATLPSAIRAVAPRVLTLNNVFRDQLDRYGEVELIATTWRAAISDLGPSATLVLNADDPTVAHLGSATRARTVTFGIEDVSVGGRALSHDADRRLCPACSARLEYSWTAYSHLGHYRCSACGWSRPQPDVTITRACLGKGEAFGSTLTIEAGGETATIQLPLPGLYNAYNALAATAASLAVGIPLASIAESIGSSEAVFGRFERIPVGDGALILALVKNPVGFNQVLRTLAMREGDGGKAVVPGSDPDEVRPPSLTLPLQGGGNAAPNDHATEGLAPPLLVIAINDLFADGTVVSWLWDVDFELLADQSYRILCTGLRAHDMALRLKYAGAPHVETEPSLSAALDAAAEAARGSQDVLLFPTYTAMLQARSELQRRGFVLPFWED